MYFFIKEEFSLKTGIYKNMNEKYELKVVLLAPVIERERRLSAP